MPWHRWSSDRQTFADTHRGRVTLGTGTLTLTGNNTHTGPTDVNAGVLAIDGNNSAATGLVTVNNGGTLRGGESGVANSGFIGGSVVINNGVW